MTLRLRKVRIALLSRPTAGTATVGTVGPVTCPKK
jgi:hypothetical protein